MTRTTLVAAVAITILAAQCSSLCAEDGPQREIRPNASATLVDTDVAKRAKALFQELVLRAGGEADKRLSEDEQKLLAEVKQLLAKYGAEKAVNPVAIVPTPKKVVTAVHIQNAARRLESRGDALTLAAHNASPAAATVLDPKTFPTLPDSRGIIRATVCGLRACCEALLDLLPPCDEEAQQSCPCTASEENKEGNQ